MTGSHFLFVLLLCVLTGSYTWGMRGTIIGGERGAMLPGAVLALVLLFAGGSAPMAAAFPMAAAIGAGGMFFGGSQTYGETIALTKESDRKKALLGKVGLAVKGAGWFGIFGGILAFGLGAMAGRYALWEVALFVIVLPIVRRLGILLINSPHDPKKNKLPKFYFSKTRREVWGGMLLVVLYIVIFSICKKEWFVVLLTLFGLIFGAIGFVVGNILQNFADAHVSKTWISGWKAMECTFGAIGALGIGFCWCLFYKSFVAQYAYEITAHSGVWSPFSVKPYTLFGFIWLLLLALFILRYWVPAPNGKKKNRLSVVLYAAEDILIYPVFCLVPLYLAAVGDLFFAQIFSFFGMFYLLADKIVFGGKARDEKKLYPVILHGVLILLAAGALSAQLFFDVAIDAYGLWLVYMLAYLIVMLAVKLDPQQISALKQKHGSFKKAFPALGAEPTWLAYALVCTVVLLILGKSYFSL